MSFFPHQQPAAQMRLAGCLVVSLAFFSLCLLPVIFIDLARQALENLHLSPTAAVLVLMGMIFGSVINLPIQRRPTEMEVVVPVFEPAGDSPVMQQYQKLRQEMVIAVNVGGCVIPVLLAVMLSRHIIDAGDFPVVVALVGIAINVGLCYRCARLVPGLGIALPVFLPAVVALGVTWLGLADPMYASCRAPVAFVIGISGPLIGADLLHWRDFTRIAAGTVSIGGAGTWDGIVLSGLLAALLS